MSSVIGSLHMDACRRCVFSDGVECSVDEQEIVDNFTVEADSVCCGCFVADLQKEGAQ